ncbi:L-arabinose isomerase [Lacticaseibacillus parakribbianus]|uniref:L-arabinose isomerase n=1 Tax=Lacticaseibacillus parakribbianus TaxID=2970927 RepID=UPI0021CAF1FC|nr:L-arabinose isomerase [Lacticaseibacillus parakribbianus]
MLKTESYRFWFIVGSQALYGEADLQQVRDDAEHIVDALNAAKTLPYPVVFKEVAIDAATITRGMKEANFDDTCAGVITWMHTFSPAKNWIRGTKLLQKPLLHLATQFRQDIPWATIDMDYMNLNQSAHGDREYGFINARLRKHNKVVYGFWGDATVQQEIADWMAVAVAYNESFNIKVARFGDNMRNVAVTEGDKIEAQIQLGWTVDYYGIGDLVDEMARVDEADIDAEYADLKARYDLVVGDNDPAFYEKQVRYQLKEKIALQRFLERGGYSAFTTNFEDLWGIEQLPGLAVQLLNREGYGFAGEGDWKTAALDRLLKIASRNQATGFMEDYTLDLRPGHEVILGSHMLEVDPTLATTKPRVEVHPLGIGDRKDPARLVFDGQVGDAIDVTVSDFGDEYRLIGYRVVAKAAEAEAPHLPVARQLWTPKAGLRRGATAWIQNGGGHHTVFSTTLTMGQLADLAALFALTFVDLDNTLEGRHAE